MSLRRRPGLRRHRLDGIVRRRRFLGRVRRMWERVLGMMALGMNGEEMMWRSRMALLEEVVVGRSGLGLGGIILSDGIKACLDWSRRCLISNCFNGSRGSSAFETSKGRFSGKQKSRMGCFINGVYNSTRPAASKLWVYYRWVWFGPDGLGLDRSTWIPGV